MNDTGIPFQLKSKQDKSREKLLELQREDLIIESKFNANLVNRVTGYTGDELKTFMEFCRFSRNFILGATELEIIQRIMVRNKVYKSRKN